MNRVFSGNIQFTREDDMSCDRLDDKSEIERYLRKNVPLHIYSIGDLDDFFWPYTAWYGKRSNGTLDSVILIYTNPQLPVVLALSEQGDTLQELFSSVIGILPSRFYAHVSPGLESVLHSRCIIESQGAYLKMSLRDASVVNDFPCPDIVPLSYTETEAALEFYSKHFPGNWFEPRILLTNQYYGAKVDGRLVSIAGVHVYSPHYRVAALGNIATIPSFRNKGYGKQVTAAACRSLLRSVDSIGLNVRADNPAAVSCYTKLGFEIIAGYREFMVQRK